MTLDEANHLCSRVTQPARPAFTLQYNGDFLAVMLNNEGQWRVASKIGFGWITPTKDQEEAILHRFSNLHPRMPAPEVSLEEVEAAQDLLASLE